MKGTMSHPVWDSESDRKDNMIADMDEYETCDEPTPTPTTTPTSKDLTAKGFKLTAKAFIPKAADKLSPDHDDTFQ